MSVLPVEVSCKPQHKGINLQRLNILIGMLVISFLVKSQVLLLQGKKKSGNEFMPFIELYLKVCPCSYKTIHIVFDYIPSKEDYECRLFYIKDEI